MESFWRHILKLVDDYGIDYVRDNSDDLLRNKRWLRRLNEVKPDRALPSLRFYARADSITEDIIPVLVSLNVVDVFIGFESGDNEILKRASKGTDVAVNMRAASLLAKAGIGVIGSFLLGLPGESKYTIQATIEHIKMLGEIAGIRRPGCAIVIPFPGTAMYDDLMCIPGMNEKYMGKDIINYDELRSDWLSRFTSVNYEYLIEVSDGLFNSDVIGSRMGFEDKVNRKLL